MKLLLFEIIIIIIIINIECILSADKYRTKFKNICGQNQPIGRIVRGSDAAIGEFPWMARIGLKRHKKTTFYSCGGSLITDRHILTAEHCFYGYSKHQLLHSLVVSLGDHDAKNRKACIGKYCSNVPVKYKVAKLIPYNMDESTFVNDISILKLAKKVCFTRWITPICLPDNTSPTGLIGENVIIIGFGTVDSYKEKDAKILQKIIVPIQPASACNVLPEPIKFGQICAGSSDKDSCDGDSGGPLFKLISQKSGPRYTQLGIVSYGSQLCEDRHPAVYTDVYYFLDWIDTNLNN